MSDQKDLLTTNRKALTVNLDDLKYGTFAEIGAGQEVARHFFQAGGAAGTIAKTISAYDMTFSDAIYGKSPRYVSRERLGLMLEHEFNLLRERLAGQRGDRTSFFAFADTVAAKSFKGNNECHGWMGIRFQTDPDSEPSQIVLHVRMWDKENILQQQALGIVGVNLIYGAFYFRDDLKKMIRSLSDNVGADRIEVDMLKFSGPAFKSVDNRLMSLHLVEYGLTNAVMFGPGGDVLQPSEVLYKKAILVERGSFRPVTHVNVDMLNCACAQFVQEPLVKGKDTIVLMEITMNLQREVLRAFGRRDSRSVWPPFPQRGKTLCLPDASKCLRALHRRRSACEYVAVRPSDAGQRLCFGRSHHREEPPSVGSSPQPLRTLAREPLHRLHRRLRSCDPRHLFS